MSGLINIHISSTTRKPEAVKGVQAHCYIGESPERTLAPQRQSYNSWPQGTQLLTDPSPSLQ